MNSSLQAWQLAALVATALSGTGLWLLLSRAGALGRTLGALLTIGGLSLAGTSGAFAGGEPRLGSWVLDLTFVKLAVITLAAAVCTISFRNPVYSAIWFGLTLLGSAGLMLFQGAQFLSLATVVVYAGAILVMFLFVLMLANPRGRSYFDRLSWEPLLASATGAVIIGLLTLSLVTVFLTGPPENRPRTAVTAEARAGEILADQHMAHLGRRLFSQHLIAIEVAGTLLLVALVGSVAVALAEREQALQRGGSGR